MFISTLKSISGFGRPPSEEHNQLDPKSAGPKFANQKYTNKYDDTYKKNKLGQITDYTYNDNEKSFSFGYDANGNVCSINSSDGWSWTRIIVSGSSDSYIGWSVRNYFDSWHVTDADCQSVSITAEGISTLGNNTSKMGLPERS